MESSLKERLSFGESPGNAVGIGGQPEDRTV